MPGRKRLAISRFIVMAMLQAARAKALGLPLESAYSWGLNRAIFYAAAKRGFGGRSGGGGGGEGGAPTEHPGRELYHLGEDEAFRDTSRSKLYFTIGDDTQTEVEFERQIAARFGGKRQFDAAWKEAESIVRASDRRTLESPNAFYAQVYKPRRDALSQKWTEEFVPDAATGAK
jgi:hypothetical protein